MKVTELKGGLLRKQDAADLLACSLRTIDRLVASGELKRIKIRGGVRYREDEIRTLIQEGEH